MDCWWAALVIDIALSPNQLLTSRRKEEVICATDMHYAQWAMPCMRWATLTASLLSSSTYFCESCILGGGNNSLRHCSAALTLGSGNDVVTFVTSLLMMTVRELKAKLQSRGLSMLWSSEWKIDLLHICSSFL